ncbi:MAG TPA: helix-hairpin-helix domain-containing protein [Terriglobales bacterium]|nr:helix-hairpin-helix domain-containing protein [Terriglobales bacterium]
MPEKINLNTAPTRELTQLPGIAKNVAYRIVRHRSRHGLFTQWEELLEVKEFPANALTRIKQRATLAPPPDIKPLDFVGPRRVKPNHLAEVAKKTKAYTRKSRAGKRQERLRPSA